MATCRGTRFAQFFIFLIFASAVTRAAHAHEPATQKLSEPIDDRINNDVTNNNGITTERSFIKYFIQSRKEHPNIINKIRRMKSYEDRYKMVTILGDELMKIIDTYRPLINNINFVPGDGEVLKNITIKFALTKVLENCALYGDVILALPDIVPRIIKKKTYWNTTLEWTLKFVDETKHLLDKSTNKMFHFVRQELNLVPRDPNYTNPYLLKNHGYTRKEKDSKKIKKIVNESKKKTGPRMVNIEF